MVDARGTAARVVDTEQLLDAGLTRPRDPRGSSAAGCTPARRRLQRRDRRTHPQGPLDGAVLAAGPGAALTTATPRPSGGSSPRTVRLIEVSAPRTRRAKRDWRSREARLPPDETTTLDGIPVTTVARTLLDLAAVETEARLERALSEAERRRLSDHTPLTELFRAPPHAKRIATLKRLTPDENVTVRGSSALFLLLLLPLQASRAALTNDESTASRVDAHWPHAGLVVESTASPSTSTHRALPRPTGSATGPC